MPAINLDPTVPRPWYLIVAYWRHVRGNCARCGRAIDYDGPRYKWIWTDRTGHAHVSSVRLPGAKRIENRVALDVGHILEKDRDSRTWWAPIDTQPEHVYCNRAAGARYRNRKVAQQRRQRRLRTSRDW